MQISKVFIAILFVVSGFALALVYQGLQTGTSIVMTPSELAEKDPSIPLRRIRVAGRVAADPQFQYVVEPATELTFHIQNPGGAGAAKPLPVVYRGLKPDMFQAGRDVIIDGEYSGGVLKASSLLTQCPSKYEAPSPEKQHGAAETSY